MSALIESVDYGLDQSELITFESETGWLSGRHKSIGSSDGAVILGEGYAGSSKYALWAEKCHGIKPDHSEETLKLFAKGKIVEPYLAELCRFEWGWDVRHDPKPSFRRSLSVPYLTASLDGWMIEDGQHVAIEMKGINAFSIRSEWDVSSGKAPLKYTIQLQHQLAVTGWKKGYLVALSGLDIYKVEVHRHEPLIAGMLSEYADFWACVESQTEPEIDESDATHSALNRVYTRREMEATHLDEEASVLVDQILELESSLKHDEALLAKQKNKLLAIAKGSDFLVTSDGDMYSFRAPKNGVKRQLKPFKGKV